MCLFAHDPALARALYGREEPEQMEFAATEIVSDHEGESMDEVAVELPRDHERPHLGAVAAR